MARKLPTEPQQTAPRLAPTAGDSEAKDEVTTKTQLLDAAEGLFEKDGIRGTSLRSITESAGANIASVNYHFGSKKDLVRAVIARRIDPLNAERLELLDAVEAKASFTLEEVLHALIAPALGHPEHNRGLQLLARLHFEPHPEVFELIHQPFAEVQQRFLAAVHKVAPSLSPLSMHWRLFFGVAAMVGTIANLQKLRSGVMRPEDLPKGAPDLGAQAADTDAITDQLVRFIAGGMLAEEANRPTSKPTRKPKNP